MSAPIPPAVGRSFAIAAGHDLAAQAALDTWEETRNIFDAAVAATLVQGVVEPHLFGLGGEVTGLVRVDGRVKVLAGATRAPAAMTIEAFERLGVDHVPGDGMLSAGPPAVLHALVLLLADHGTLPFSRVAEHAIDAAEDGFDVGELLAFVIAADEESFRSFWPTSCDVWMPEGRPPLVGERITQPALASTLRRLGAARDPAEEMRTGFVAQEILAFASQEHPGVHGSHRSFLEADDLASFEVGWEEPVTWTDRHGRTICKAGPWTQGPMLLQQLALMEAGGWDASAPLDPDLLHATLETFKLAFADREGYFGDPRFVDAHLDALMSDDYLQERASLVALDAAGDPGPGLVGDVRPWSYAPVGTRGKVGDTTHLDLADGHGNLVAFTPSGGWFASPVIPSLGFPLGTRCQTFWLDAAHPNRLVPGKRPRTTLTPTIVLKGGRPSYALGTPGGDNQDQVQSQMLHALAHGRSPEETVELPTVTTIHPPSSFAPHGREAQGVSHEDGIDEGLCKALAARGHRLLSAGRWGHGRPHVIEIGTVGSIRAAVSRGLGGTGRVLAR